jgi:large subunit ribosomal protein L15
MFELHTLTPLTHDRKRIGRGGSRGGSSGKGTKGQKARSGGAVPARFEGGQMPLSRRLPKRGFNNAEFATTYEIVNIDRLNSAFVDGDEVTIQALVDHKLIKVPASKKIQVKILGNGSLDKKLNVSIHAISASARKTIEAAGGSVTLL